MLVPAERPGTGLWPPRLIIIGEGPGVEEERTGKPFVGRSGEQLNAALAKAGVDRRDCYVTNIMKVRCVDAHGKDRAPTGDETTAAMYGIGIRELVLTGGPDVPGLIDEIVHVLTEGWKGWSQAPRLLLIGSSATRAVLDLDTPRYDAVGGMDTLNGQAFELPVGHPWAGAVVVPCYHPAAGLRDSRRMTDFFWAVREANRPGAPVTKIQVGADAKGALDELRRSLESGPLSIDTESDGDRPWCATTAGPFNWHIPLRVPPAKGPTRTALDTPAVYHNGLYDIGVLERAGARPKVKADTMVAAYHLGTEPLGLKQLVFRHFGLLSPTWDQMVAPADAIRLGEWALDVTLRDWPPPVGRKKPVATRFQSLLKKLEREGPRAIRTVWADHDLYDVVTPACPIPPQASLADIDFAKAKEYAMADPVYTGALHQRLDPRIDEMKLRAVYETDIAITPLVAHMQRVGMPVNLTKVRALEPRLKAEMGEIAERGEQLMAREVNLASGDQLAAALLESGATLEKLTPGGKPSTSKQVLKAIAADSELAQLGLDYRERHKLLNTFVPALLKHACATSGGLFDSPNPTDWRIHPQIRMTNTETGRLSCHDPNLLAFPARTKLGIAIRDCFEAPRGWSWVGADLDQIEMRLLAHVSGDPAMQAAVRSEDMHALTASKMFRQPLDYVRKGAPGEKKYRTPAKTIGFLVAYRGGPNKLREGMAAEGIVEPVEYWAKAIDDWYAVYPGVRRWQRARDAEADTFGYVRDMWGKLRHVEGVWSTDSGTRSACQREASNFPIQSGAQGLLKRAMIRVWDLMQSTRWVGKVQCLLQIHDELVFLVVQGRAQEWAAELQKIMVADQHLFSVPLSSTSQIAKTWGGLK